MTSREGHREYPGRLAGLLAELRKRLRLSSSGVERAPAALDRLRITAILLPELADHDPGFVELGAELDRLRAAMETDPAIWPETLDAPLADLAQFLEGVLAAADAGDGHPGSVDGWRRQLDAWEAAPACRDASAGPRDPADLEETGGILVLVVAGGMMEARLRDRVEAAGYEAVAAGTDEALEAARGVTAAGILVDDLEPDRNLSRLAEAAQGEGPPLVLVSGGMGDPRAETARALRGGAVGAWCEPWTPDSLVRILQQPSHP